MLRPAFRPYVAVLLLLCFGRTLLPETWVLALHAHTHTADEPAYQRTAAKGKLLISSKHQHCATEQFYNAAFQAAAPVRLPVPPVAVHYAPQPRSANVRPAAPVRAGPTALRGPPHLTT